jgi:mRNA-degrading endonuclease toxin of MazEF toxin-antitoxin module
VSDTGFNRLQHRILVVVPMTTTVRDYAFHVAAEPEHTGLRKPGMIMCDQILTIAAERLLDAEPAGRVSEELMAVVEDRIAILLGLPSPEPQLA